LIESISTTIPEDAAWETQHQLSNEEWKYLVNYIKAPNALYGQLPREVEMDFSMILLEKERAIAGGANFGHAPRDDDWNMSNSPDITQFHKSLVVQLPAGSVPATRKKEPDRQTAPIDSVKDVDDTIKIYGKRFLSSKGDSGSVKINDETKTAALWSDTLIKVTFAETYENAIVKNAGSYKDTSGEISTGETNTITFPFTKVTNKKFNSRKDTTAVICSTGTVKSSFWLFATADTSQAATIVDSSIGLAVGSKDTLQSTVGTRFLKVITRTTE
jgi:hypothetical protein